MTSTNERYTTHTKVNGLLRLPTVFDNSTPTNPSQAQVENLIEEKMSIIDQELQTSFHLNSLSLEYHDIDDFYQEFSGFRVFLNRERIVTPLSATAGDSLQIWTGVAYQEYVGVKTESRTGDFWVEETRGILHMRNYTGGQYIPIKMTYRFNEGARAVESGSLTSNGTTLTVDSTANFPFQGSLRIGDEEIRYNSKTATTFTLVERGAFGTTAATHADTDIVFWCPKDIEELCTKMVAIELLSSEDWSSPGLISGVMGSAQMQISSRIDKWKEDCESIMSRRRKPIVGLK